MHQEPGGTFGAETGAVEIATKHINRQLVVLLLIAVVDFVTLMRKYGWTVIGAAAAAIVALGVPGMRKRTPLQ